MSKPLLKTISAASGSNHILYSAYYVTFPLLKHPPIMTIFSILWRTSGNYEIKLAILVNEPVQHNLIF
jgi:hypothetical protein